MSLVQLKCPGYVKKCATPDEERHSTEAVLSESTGLIPVVIQEISGRVRVRCSMNKGGLCVAGKGYRFGGKYTFQPDNKALREYEVEQIRCVFEDE